MPERKIKTEIPDEVENKKTPTPKAPAQNLSSLKRNKKRNLSPSLREKNKRNPPRR